MARQKSKPTPPPPAAKVPVLSVRGSPAWRDWVGRLADHNRSKVADMVDDALVAWAKSSGFSEEPPKR